MELQLNNLTLPHKIINYLNTIISLTLFKLLNKTIFPFYVYITSKRARCIYLNPYFIKLRQTALYLDANVPGILLKQVRVSVLEYTQIQ